MLRISLIQNEIVAERSFRLSASALAPHSPAAWLVFHRENQFYIEPNESSFENSMQRIVTIITKIFMHIIEKM